MTQSWLVALYLDCPTATLPSLHCPTASAIQGFEQAVRQGDIWWHAFPHNAELAAAGASMVTAGLNLTHALDKRFGLGSRIWGQKMGSEGSRLPESERGV